MGHGAWAKRPQFPTEEMEQAYGCFPLTLWLYERLQSQ